MKPAENAIHTSEASIDIAAPPEAVYAMVSDITRMGEWSPEAVGGTSPEMYDARIAMTGPMMEQTLASLKAAAEA